MTENEKKYGFASIVKEVFSYLSQIVSAGILPKILQSADKVMRNIHYSLIQVEKRIFKKIYSLLMISFGGLFLTFSLFFLLKEYLGFSNSLAFFLIGIFIFMIGIMLKIGENDVK